MDTFLDRFITCLTYVLMATTFAYAVGFVVRATAAVYEWTLKTTKKVVIWLRNSGD